MINNCLKTEVTAAAIYYQIRIWNKFENKLHQLSTRCVTGVTRTLITLFEFINCINRKINGETEFANL